MADFDLDKICQRLRALPDFATEIEKLFEKDHPGATSLSSEDRVARRTWLRKQLELPDGYSIRLHPTDEAQEIWVIELQYLDGGGFHPVGSIQIDAFTHFGITHWLMTFAWMDSGPDHDPDSDEL